MSKRVLSVSETEICGLGMDRCLTLPGGPSVEICTEPDTVAALIEREHPDLVLIWLITSEDAGFRLCRELVGRWPGLPVILACLDPDEPTIADAAFVRARACIDARLPCEEIQRLVDVVLRGGSLFTASQLEASRLVAPLSRREVQVLSLAARGFSRNQIAAALGTRPGTVRNQLAEARAKLAVRTTPAAVARARRRGLIPS